MHYRRYRRYSHRRRRSLFKTMAIRAVCLLIFCGLFSGGIFFGKKILGQNANSTSIINPVSPAANGGTNTDIELTISAESPTDTLLKEAELLAKGYDYDAAITLLKSDTSLQQHTRIQMAVAAYEAVKETLVRVDIEQVTHIFFHSLIVDHQKAFDGDRDESGYNQVMTTADEFIKILESMYEKGYVLVSLHDMAGETTDETGSIVMKAKDIMLPEGKKPFVMSQDDVCYYPYMDGDGFASRMVIGADGKPTTEMKMDDGTVSVGSYDLVPILEDFIQEHPDFSYQGARAVLAFTGYEGILGYRTTASYQDSETYEQDREQAAKVAQCLRENGWELASHSWGHRNFGKIDGEYAISDDQFKSDCDKWENEVESLIGPTDIILFPFGSDIGDWHPYSADNQRFNHMQSLGFRYFCNVDSSRYWVQLGDTFIRQGRRNLDGYRMWQDISAADPATRRLDDLFRAEDVFDKDRPTPVPGM